MNKVQICSSMYRSFNPDVLDIFAINQISANTFIKGKDVRRCLFSYKIK